MECEQVIKLHGSTHLNVARVSKCWRLDEWIARTLLMLGIERAVALSSVRTLRANRAHPEGNCPSSRPSNSQLKLALSSLTWKCTTMVSTMLMTVLLVEWIPRWKQPMRITLYKKLRASEHASRLDTN